MLRLASMISMLMLGGLVTLILPLLAGAPRATSSRCLLLVTNKGDRTLSIVDPVAGKEISTVPESGVTGHEVIASPDGRTAYVPIYGNSGVGQPGSDGQTLDVIDLASRKITTTIDFGRGERPHCAKFNPKDGLLYVTTEITNTVSIIDPKSNKVVGSIPTGQPESHMLAITSDGRRGYTSNVGPGLVSVLDLENRKLLGTIKVVDGAQRISLTRDDRLAFTSDQHEPRLAVIDTTGYKVERWVPMPGVGYGTAPTPDGRWLLVALIKINKVGVIDLKEMKVVRTFDVPSAPQEVLVEPDGKAAYVSCDASRKVAVIDLAGAPADWKVARLIDVGRGADGLAWAALN